jgi:hypothetical protein
MAAEATALVFEAGDYAMSRAQQSSGEFFRQHLSVNNNQSALSTRDPNR